MQFLDPAFAADIFDGLRLLEGRRRSVGEEMSPAAIEFLRAFSPSGAIPSHQSLAAGERDFDYGGVTPLFELNEVARVLRVSTATVERLARSGDLVTVHIGRRRLVRPSDLRAFIDELDPAA